MTKKRSQASHFQLKEEENEGERKLNQLLHNTNRAKDNKRRVTKYKRIETWVDISPRFLKVKTENKNNNEPALNSTSSSSSTLPTLKRLPITTKQVEELIKYMVNDKATITAAAAKVGMSDVTARRYYHEYECDPEHRIPTPKSSLKSKHENLTQKNIDDLIRYITDHKMTLTQAASKANIDRSTAVRYYTKYMRDPDHKIPVLHVFGSPLSTRYSQQQINDVISYIVKDKMSIVAASKKANMSANTARIYYSKYLKDPNHAIPTLPKPNPRSSKSCTNAEVKALIGYIVDEGMTIRDASIKAKMGESTAGRYYSQYLNDPEHKIPTPEDRQTRPPINPLTLDQIKTFFNSAIIDKMNIIQASKKAKISKTTGSKLYNNYVKYPKERVENTDTFYSVEKMKKMIEYIEKDNVSIASAAKKVNLGYNAAVRFYRQYVDDPEHKIPLVKAIRYNYDYIKRLIRCIEEDKMSVKSAAESLNMHEDTAAKYYKAYLNDPEHKIPVQFFGGYKVKQKMFNKYSQIVADIYKNNPSIKPIHEKNSINSDTSDIKIKLEPEEEDPNTNVNN